jgi:hypothetical protein
MPPFKKTMGVCCPYVFPKYGRISFSAGRFAICGAERIAAGCGMKNFGLCLFKIFLVSHFLDSLRCHMRGRKNCRRVRHERGESPYSPFQKALFKRHIDFSEADGLFIYAAPKLPRIFDFDEINKFAAPPDFFHGDTCF